MSHKDVVRSWKDPQFRASLSDGQRARLPENPAGLVEIPETDLTAVAGGDADPQCWSMFWTACCTITLQ